MRHAQHIPQKLTPVALPPGVSFGFVHLASRLEGLNARGPKLSAVVLRRLGQMSWVSTRSSSSLHRATKA
jgi:hypothetical protein